MILHLGFHRNVTKMIDAVKYRSHSSFIDIDVVDEGYGYRDKVDVECPFPCNPYYDLKTWKWLMANYQTLQQPIVFWNIGA